MTQPRGEKQDVFTIRYGEMQQKPLRLQPDDEFLVFFDANVLLNLIEFGEKTREEIFDILENEKLKPRLRITHHTGLEFYNSFEKVCLESRNRHTEVTRSIDKAISDLKRYYKNNKLEFGDGARELFKDFEGKSEAVREAVVNTKDVKQGGHKNHNSRLLSRIGSLFEDKILDKLEDHEIQLLQYSGTYRFDYNIPPGFKDEGKGGSRRFGDFIIWYEMMNYCKNSSKDSVADFIFVTDDTKVDWWDKSRSKSKAAKDEIKSANPSYIIQDHEPNGKLIREFNYITKKHIRIVRMDEFIELISQFTGVKRNDELISTVGNANSEKLVIALKQQVEDYIAKLTNYTSILKVNDERLKAESDSDRRHFLNLSIVFAVYRYIEQYQLKHSNKLRNDHLKSLYEQIYTGAIFNFELFNKDEGYADAMADAYAAAIEDELDQLSPKNARW